MVRVVFHRDCAPGKPAWLCSQDLVGTVQARVASEVKPALEAVQRAAGEGLWAAGFVAYEAAGGISSELVTHPGPALPLVWFGLFRTMALHETPAAAADGAFALGPWRPSIARGQFDAAVERIKAYIAAGDTYQVNYSFRLRASFAGEAWPLFVRLCRAQRAQYGAYIDLGDHIICSASPELFFSLSGGELVTRPMKGTAARGLSCEEDRQQRQALANSAKDRAENAMIVDMLRNDVGRIADIGSVAVADAFRLEKYPTVWQMTSAVTGRTAAPFAQIMEALFPCASITGAPKVRTMQIIRELEDEPRGVYTGCIGYLAPDGRAQFSVAIRTVAIDRCRQVAEYGVGGGIVWDSSAHEEYAECLAKSEVLMVEPAAFELLETLLWTPREGYFLLEEHLRRLRDSAEYFDYDVDIETIRQRLAEFAGSLPGESQRVRLRADALRGVSLEHAAISPLAYPYRVRLALQPIGRHDVFLYHKTTQRQAYDTVRDSLDDCDDVILWNQEQQVTETCVANLVIEMDGSRYTPPVACGLLAGTFREHLLATGQVQERVITLAELRSATRVFAVNSVRRWLPAFVLFP